MVRQLEEIRRELRAGRQQGRLARPLDVARQQQRVAGDLEPQHQGSVVARERGGAGRRPQHLRRHVAPTPTAAARVLLAQPRPGAVGGSAQRRERGRSEAAGRQPDLAAGQRLEHRDQTATVIEVPV
ncbi:MAG: hypothetical protein ACR2P8_15350, partial [Myxococcota bacterium]